MCLLETSEPSKLIFSLMYQPRRCDHVRVPVLSLTRCTIKHVQIMSLTQTGLDVPDGQPGITTLRAIAQVKCVQPPIA